MPFYAYILLMILVPSEGFVQFSNLTAVYIDKAIKQVLHAILNLGGQGYDGASNMSSEKCVVQAEIVARLNRKNNAK